ncbi:hypothetical protein like AT4G10720 [Hibiscus trionum]|uniref:PGG domain-containing protein n=1 Tax=Hibiscus trionum TaxID=183268 RepID=A0A9W7MAH0_HIBTR|nr:hypothetical protein like AT4G10720 [Hibiscus trionum]
MDQSLRTAARTGDIGELYSLIQRDGNVLRRIDEVEFVDTPLHIAADEGCVAFAMEIMNLKPSFAWKLNPQGLTPLHVAVKKGHKEMALSFLEIDKDLARVRGKNGETPLHFVSKVGNPDGLLDRFMEICPECIRDVTIKNRTALHIAVENNRLDVFRVLIRALTKKDYCREVVNRKDEDGNTALHIAAIHNQPEMLKLLLNCKADKHATNLVGSTALDVAQQHNNIESIIVLRGCFGPGVSNFKHKLEKQIINYVSKASLLVFHDLDDVSGDDRNALLVILGLLLATTYQATLSPPGGVWQGEINSKSEGSYDSTVPVPAPGTSVLDPLSFLLFYVPTFIVFIVTFFLTLALIKPYPHGFRTALEVLLAFVAISFDQSIFIIAPSYVEYIVINISSSIVFFLMVFMCIAYRVSKISVSIVGCRISLLVLLIISKNEIFVGAIQGLLLSLFLYDEFWKGSIVTIGCSMFLTITARVGGGSSLRYPIVLVGCWLFFNLCRFCIRRCFKWCNTVICRTFG